MTRINLKPVNLFTYVIVCTLVLLMTVQPVIKLVGYSEDIKQEFVELQGNENSQEKEILEVDDEHKELKLIASNLTDQSRFKRSSFFNSQNNFTEYKPAIYLQPPRH